MRIETEVIPAGRWDVDKNHSNVGFAVARNLIAEVDANTALRVTS